jgi:iron complex outermembrane recepter protein
MATRELRANRKLTANAIASVLVLAGPSLAAAQSASQPGAAQQTSANSEYGGAQAGQLGEVVVVAQRRQENLQQIPLSATAVSAEALAQANITTALDLAKVVPSVLLDQNNGTVTTFIRGIGNAINTQGNEASVPVYIDGVYYPRLSAGLLRLDSVDHIEVLEGPQGTLFGRNATGGLIQIITKEPHPGDAPNGSVEVGYGSFGTVNTSGYLAAGLSPAIAADIGINYYDNRGFGTDVATGRDTNFERSLALRSKWVFQPSDSTKIVLTGDYSHSNTDIGLPGQLPSGPGPGIGYTGYPDGSGLVPRIGYYDRSLDGTTFYAPNRYDASLRVEQDLGFAKLVSLSAYNDETDQFQEDLDRTSQPAGWGDLDQEHTKNYSEDLQLLSNAGGPIEWIVGAYYFHMDTGYTPAYLFGPSYGGALSGPLGPTGLILSGLQTTNSYALYGQTSFDIQPTWKLTLGTRLSKDETDASGSLGFGGYGGTLATISPETSSDHSNGEVGWKVALDHQLTDDLMAYVSSSRGYKAGLYNLLPFSTTYIQPEVLTAYELGVKSELLDHRLRLNGALFYYDQKHPQVNTSVDGALTVLNANAAKVKGGELQATAFITDAISLRFGATYLDAYYTNFPNAPLFAPDPVAPYGDLLEPNGINAKGFPLIYAPRFSGNVGLDYRLPTPQGNWAFSSNFHYTSAYNFTADGRLRQDPVGLLDAQVSYTFQNPAATLKFWGSNLTGRQYALWELETQGQGGDVGAAAAPREYGVTVSFKF